MILYLLNVCVNEGRLRGLFVDCVIDITIPSCNMEIIRLASV